MTSAQLAEFARIAHREAMAIYGVTLLPYLRRGYIARGMGDSLRFALTHKSRFTEGLDHGKYEGEAAAAIETGYQQAEYEAKGGVDIASKARQMLRKEPVAFLSI